MGKRNKISNELIDKIYPTYIETLSQKDAAIKL
jgi:hypothetical protein